MTPCRASLLLAAILAAPATLAQAPEQDPAADEGRRLYEFYCRSCHGEQGRGDGPTAQILKVRPADLTRLTKTPDGEFPVERVTAFIDGRERLEGHGSEMPIWGLGFQDPTSDANQEEGVAHRISALVAYLKTLQR